ncbi:hypothetical protein CFBP6411_03253 [Pseudomonas syringae group genomosp. 3]|uniref:DUF2971 domain-containing protein n=1 Tax=Pseudomonas syringae group genomosp. 3 TaxID=251701 RepID=A0A2K4WFD5_9PSED|nr:DUF2971 domain-containing protein [Pseudomonas syringae group genomosp. 3]SOS34610.1 hypothetical protein CFBP6411_03253 [Pseudomonas syringae group genomosp. 3]
MWFESARTQEVESLAIYYHYCNEKFGLENIRKNRLKVAEIKDLNDPFEMLCYSSTERELRKLAVHMRARVSEELGMLCFSKSLASPVQWAHYADKHRGMCLAFEIDESQLAEVKYKHGRIEFDLASYSKMLKRERHSYMLDQLDIKSSEWKYEKESRQIVSLCDADFDVKKERYFLQFSDIGVLKKVFIGCNSTLTRKRLDRALTRGGGLGVATAKMRTAFKSYTMVVNKRADLWL